MDRTPLRRIGDPEPDIGPVAVFLASDLSRYMTGQVLIVDGAGSWPSPNEPPSSSPCGQRSTTRSRPGRRAAQQEVARRGRLERIRVVLRPLRRGAPVSQVWQTP